MEQEFKSLKNRFGSIDKACQIYVENYMVDYISNHQEIYSTDILDNKDKLIFTALRYEITMNGTAIDILVRMKHPSDCWSDKDTSIEVFISDFYRSLKSIQETEYSKIDYSEFYIVPNQCHINHDFIVEMFNKCLEMKEFETAANLILQCQQILPIVKRFKKSASDYLSFKATKNEKHAASELVEKCYKLTKKSEVRMAKLMKELNNVSNVHKHILGACQTYIECYWKEQITQEDVFEGEIENLSDYKPVVYNFYIDEFNKIIVNIRLRNEWQGKEDCFARKEILLEDLDKFSDTYSLEEIILDNQEYWEE